MKKYFLFILTALIIGAGVQNAVSAEPVVYNTQTQKVHKVNCQWAKKCTKNCVKIDRKDAYARGGIRCKSCGG